MAFYNFKFCTKTLEQRARLGKSNSPWRVPTPSYAVGNPGHVKALAPRKHQGPGRRDDSEQYYHLYLRPGHHSSVIGRAAPIHALDGPF